MLILLDTAFGYEGGGDNAAGAFEFPPASAIERGV